MANGVLYRKGWWTTAGSGDQDELTAVLESMNDGSLAPDDEDLGIDVDEPSQIDQDGIDGTNEKQGSAYRPLNRTV